MRLNVRTLHLYLGMFIAPSVLFFAATGALQLFSLHEGHGAYHPAPLIEKLGAVHKDQKFAIHEEPKEEEAAPAALEEHEHEHEAPAVSTLALKWFFLTVALGLIASTCLGVWMGFTHVVRKKIAIGLFGLGAVIPLVLLLL